MDKPVDKVLTKCILTPTFSYMNLFVYNIILFTVIIEENYWSNHEKVEFLYKLKSAMSSCVGLKFSFA